MNKEQLEKIRNKCKEINELLQSDIEGAHWLVEYYVKFSNQVNTILSAIANEE